MIDDIDDLFHSRGASATCLGDIQRQRLMRLMQRYRTQVAWDGQSAVTAPAAAVFVMQAVNATQVETLIGALHENSVVILPFGENPAFDLLKSRLHAYGSIGAEGWLAPHHVWWGGVKPLAVPTGLYRKKDTLFMSSVGADIDSGYPGRLARDMQQIGLELALDLPGTRRGGSAKIDFIIAQWEQSSRPVFWIDPNAAVYQHPLLPQALECDFAVQQRTSGEMQPGALFFNQTEPARALLDVWQRLTRAYPELPEAFLLDQAWTLATSQRQLETAWLPETYGRAGTPEIRERDAVIQYDSSQATQPPQDDLTWRCQRARRFGRHEAPEAHLVMPGTARSRGQITVLLRDVLASGAEDVSAAVEAVARAFAHDPAGFAQMELVLCAWESDVERVMQIDDDSWVLVTEPSERLEPDTFGTLDLSTQVTSITAARQIYSAANRSPSVLHLVNSLPGDRPEQHNQQLPSLLRRPLATALD
jgi:hypothetical protein